MQFCTVNWRKKCIWIFPPGFEEMYGNEKICKLKKSLYGLKRLLEPGLKDTHDLFSNMGNVISDQPKMAIVYIDDIVLISSDMHEMENLKQLMAKEFEIKGS
ncbi:hypothetical protein CK203_048248 [Vitis vinifera]|uniref:Reverse transcriptase Ty1/copia-type domain-containing protein n=1 Tax=Vitis vinifera TaxID=29760 RepID=A0A438H104_VITVI|nr:hypothetical protein CK203_048248 [Vitis vinifera]